MNTMTVAQTDTRAAAESNVTMAEKDREERTKDGAGWEREKTHRKHSEYWNDPRWNQRWTGVSQPWHETGRHQANEAE